MRDRGSSTARGGFWPGEAFAALRHRNYRLYFTGQFISMSGTWLQSSLFSLQRAQAIVAVVLTMFGTSLLVSSIVSAVH